MTRKEAKPGDWLFPVAIVILILFFISITLYNSCYADTVYRVLHSSRAIGRIEMRVISDPGSAISRDTVITDSGVLQKFNAALQGGERIAFDAPRTDSIFIDMNIYKNRKVNISVLKIINKGWVVGVGDDWYRNDTLINLMIPYLFANNH